VKKILNRSDPEVQTPRFKIGLTPRFTRGSRGKQFHFRIRLANGNIINVAQWAHDIFQAQFMIQQRYPGSVVLQVVDE